MSEQESRRWIDEAEEALDRTTVALRAAWDESREARMSALEAAKEAASRLGKAIDRGMEAAKEAWEPAASEEPSPSGDRVEAVEEEEPDDSTSSHP